MVPKMRIVWLQRDIFYHLSLLYAVDRTSVKNEVPIS
jgi:hypothetical protein